MTAAPHVVPNVGVGVGVGVLATAVGGAAGALARWALTEAFPATVGQLPWTVLLINVLGSGLLAALPRVAAVARRPWLVVLLGSGVLGGFTTMSAASFDTFTLLDRGEAGLAAAYALGTLGAALAAVLIVDRLPVSRRGNAAAADRPAAGDPV